MSGHRWATAAVLSLLALAGCIEREERITLGADGSVTVVHVLEGDRLDLEGGAAALPYEGFRVRSYALPAEDPRTRVLVELKKLRHPEVEPLLPDLVRVLKKPKSGGHETVFAKLKAIDDPAVRRLLPLFWNALKEPNRVRPPRSAYEATATYGSVDEMPTSFAAAGSKTAAQALRWKDKVESRQVDGRTLHTFTRTYEPRRWGRYAFGARRWVNEQVVSDLMRWPSLKEKRKFQVMQSLLAWERFKHQEFVASAIREVVPDHALRTEAVLTTREALASRALDTESILKVLRLPEPALKKKCAALMAGFRRAALESAYRTLALDDATKERFRAAYRSARLDFEVTDDLADESFTIRLTVPGKVVRHDGDEIDGRTVTWRFKGEDLRDRRHRLAAVWEAE